MILFRSHDFSAIMIESGRKLGDKTRCQIRQPQYLALIQYVSKPSNFKQWSTSITTCALSHSSRKGNAWNEARRARQTSKEQGLYWNKHDQAQSFALSSHVNYWTKPQLVKDTNKEISNEWQKKKNVFLVPWNVKIFLLYPSEIWLREIQNFFTELCLKTAVGFVRATDTNCFIITIYRILQKNFKQI